MNKLLAFLVAAVLTAAAVGAATVEVTTKDGRGADAVVDFGSTSKNMGDVDKLHVKRGPHAAGNRKVYLRFDVAEAKAKAGDLTAAALTLTIAAGTPGEWSYNVIGVKESDAYGAGQLGEDWDESTVSWATAPGNSKQSPDGIADGYAVPLGTFDLKKGQKGKAVTFASKALADFIAADTNGLVTLVIARRSTDNNVVAFSSKEGEAPPRLTLNPSADAGAPATAPAPAPAPAPAAQSGSPLSSPATLPRVSVEAPPVTGPGAYPADAGLVNVKSFGAKGDGKADDTLAIQAALDAHPSGNRVIYLPNGTYVVSATLAWPKGPGEGQYAKRTILQGQSRDGAVLRLADAAPGFGDPARPQAVLFTGNKPAQRFRNALRTLTIDTGAGNPGAIGARFNASNQGTVRDVTIRAGGDGSGAIGLDMTFTDEVGPLLVKNVAVEGFDVGVACSRGVNSQTFEHLTLSGQRVVGLRNAGQVISIRGLRSTNAVPAVQNAGGSGLVTLIDSELTGTAGAGGQPAVDNAAGLFARGVRTSGYAVAIRNATGTNAGVDGATVDAFTSHPAVGPGTRSLDLPVVETPVVPWEDDASRWAGPHQFGGQLGDDADDTAAIQQACDSGASTVYLPGGGKWQVDGEVRVPATVRRIIGCEATVRGGGTIAVGPGDAPLVIERVDAIYSKLKIAHAGPRTLVLASVSDVHYHAQPGAGDLFAEDLVAGPITILNGQKFFARQLNLESARTKLTNDGGQVWILGLKTEREGTLVDTRAGGATEVLGAFCYSTKDEKTMPMFLNDGGALSATVGEACFNNKPFVTLVEERQGGEATQVMKGDVPGRAGGSMVVLYAGKDAARP